MRTRVRESAAASRTRSAARTSKRRQEMLQTFDRLLLAVNRWLVIALLAAMATMVFANVLLRFLTDHSILWVEEASRYAMVWLTFIGAGPVLRYGGHIGIDTLQQALPRAAAALRAAVFALLALFSGVMVVVGIRYAMLTWAQTTPVMEIPVGAVYLAMPVGFALLLIHLAVMFRGYVARRELLGDGEFDADAARL
jgi:TRAP-type C4-dicarboxylate transport system permease small subunit